MRLNLRVTYLDGSAADVTATAADLVAFEQRWDKSVVSFGDNLRMTDLCWLAWHATKRSKADTPEFDSWIETVEFVGAAETPELVPLGTNQPIG